MAIASILPGGYVLDIVSLTIIFIAVLMLMTIASAGLFHTYRSRFGMSGAGSAGDISEAPIEKGGRATPDSARASLEVRGVTRRKRVFRGWKAPMEGEVETERHPLHAVSEVERWKVVVSFVATAGLGVVAYILGDLSLGPDSVIALASLVVFFLGAVLLSRCFMSLRRYHVARATPTTNASDVTPGDTVEMYGKAVVSDQRTHKAPFTDDDCVVCEYEIIEKSGRDEVVDSGTAGVLFYVDDGTGRVLVDPDEAELMMALDTKVEVKSKRPPPEITGGYVDIGVNEERSEYRERYVKPGDNVYVYGDAVASDEYDVVINKQRKDSYFMIADSSEGELRKSLLSRAAVYGMTGIVLMSVGMGVVFRLSGVSVV